MDDPMDLCSMMPDGHCGQAGSEYCEFDCPFRYEQDYGHAEREGAE